jgi:hypothetical protein
MKTNHKALALCPVYETDWPHWVAGCYNRNMIGNETDAARALAGVGEYVGEGHTRTVYRIGDVVYKVARHSASENVTEYDNANELRPHTPDNVVVPEMSLHHVAGTIVLAMPFINGKSMGECMGQYGMDCDHSDCYSPGMRNALDDLNNDATSYGNVIHSDGIYYLIDLSADNNVRTLA